MKDQEIPDNKPELTKQDLDELEAYIYELLTEDMVNKALNE